jgi:hypothetical protein
MSAILDKDKKEEKQDSSSSDDDEKKDKKNNEGSSKLTGILADALSHDKDRKPSSDSPHHDASNLIKIAGEIIKPKLAELSDEAKLDMIKTLTGTLAENHVDPKFSLPWLLIYLHELQKSKNADEATKAAFNKWAWEAFNESPVRPASAGHEKLGNVPSSVMIQFVNDIAKQKHSDSDIQKVCAVFSDLM